VKKTVRIADLGFKLNLGFQIIYFDFWTLIFELEADHAIVIRQSKIVNSLQPITFL
jgi:hypothetical protein